MKSYRLAVLPGDGIGPEVTTEAVRVLEATGERFGFELDLDYCSIGAAGVTVAGEPFPPDTRIAVLRADAVLLGAVGDPSLDQAPRARRPETGLLALRQTLGVYANLRPVTPHPALLEHSPLRPERLRNVDVLIVRELTGGLYYGEPRGRDGDRAVNTMAYTRTEVERIARLAFEAARQRRGHVTSVDKANVLEVSQLWRETVTKVSREFPDVRLDHCYVDTAAMRLVTQPSNFDVLLTENMFGDILSDEAAVLAGALGLLPSASLGNGPGLFEPIHGSAPDIAGSDRANPLGAILSAAMLLRYGLGLMAEADAVQRAVRTVLDSGVRTADLAGPGSKIATTREVGERVADLVSHVVPVP